MHLIVIAALLVAPLLAEDLLQVKFAKKDPVLSADPKTKFWKDVAPILATKNNMGVETPGHRTEIRARWTAGNLYVLMTCPYEELYLIPNPVTNAETNKLWEHDAAEIFIGADFDKIHRYREYQVSPQGEWVDLDIDSKLFLPDGWKWDSGMKVKARIDAQAKVWYGEFQIPLSSITEKPVKVGTMMRGNFYRFQGPPPNRKAVAWVQTERASNHTPEKFAKIQFVK